VEQTTSGTIITTTTIVLAYDVFNNLIGESVNGAQQRWTVYDGKNPYMDFNGAGTLTAHYLANPEGLNQFYGQVDSAGAIQWYLTDLDGSIREVVSGSGTVLDQINYDPYGNIIGSSGFPVGRIISVTTYGERFGMENYRVSSTGGGYKSSPPQ